MDFGFTSPPTVAVGGPHLCYLKKILICFLTTVYKKKTFNFTEMINNFSFEDMVSFDYNSPLDVSEHFGTFNSFI